MESFAERIIEKSTHIKSDLEELVKNTTRATVQVSCAFNELTNLASSQFVANVIFIQVIPESVPEAPKVEENTDQQNPSPIEKRQATTTLSAARMEKIHSQEMREQNLLPKHQKAILMGIKALKVDELMKEGTSDDGVSLSSIGSQVFRGTIKKLPHIIGTSYFYHDPWIGLFEEDEQKLESNDEAFTVVFEAKDAPKAGESPNNTVANNPGYSPPVPPPMQKINTGLPSKNGPAQFSPPSNVIPPPPPPPPKAVPPPPPPPPSQVSKSSKGGPPPPPPPSNNAAPPPAFNNFQRGLTMTLEKRKAIIDGEIEGDLSVKNVLTDESKALGLPPPPKAANPSASKPNPPMPPNQKPNASRPNPPIPPYQESNASRPNPPLPPYQESNARPNPGFQESNTTYDPSVSQQPKKPEEMTLEDKKRQLAGILGGMPQMRPRQEPPAESSNQNIPDSNPSYQNPPDKAFQTAPSLYPPPPPSQNPMNPVSNFKPKEEKSEQRVPTGIFFQNIQEEDELNTLFRTNTKPVSKDRNSNKLFDFSVDEEKKNPKNEARKTRADFKFIDDDDEDTANLLLNSELAKKKLVNTTVENPFLLGSQKKEENPLLFKNLSSDSKPLEPKEENPLLFKNSITESKPEQSKPKQANPFLFSKAAEEPISQNISDDPLSAFSSESKSPTKTENKDRVSNSFASPNEKTPTLSFTTTENQSPRPSIKDMQANIPMPVFGGPPPSRQDKPTEVSHDITMLKPVRQRAIRGSTAKFDEFEGGDEEPLGKEKTLPLTVERKSITPVQSKPVSLVEEDKIKMPEVLPSFNQPEPRLSAPNNPPVTFKPPPQSRVENKPSGRKEVSFDPLMSGFKPSEKKTTPRPSVNKEDTTKATPRPLVNREEEKKTKPRANLFDEDDDEMTFRPSIKPAAQKEAPKKVRGSLFDD